MANVILRDVHKTYPGGVEAIKGINFEVGDGQWSVEARMQPPGLVGGTDSGPSQVLSQVRAILVR